MRKIIDSFTNKKRLIILISGLLLLILIVVFLVAFFTSPARDLQKARKLMADHKYLEAKKIYEAGGRNNYYLKIEECDDLYVEYLMDQKQYKEAREYLTDVIGVSSTYEPLKECDYYIAEELFNEGKYDEAYDIYSKLGDYNDSEDKARECKYQHAIALLDKGSMGEAELVFIELKDYKDSEEKVDELKKESLYQLALDNMEKEHFITALKQFTELNGYKDSKEYMDKCLEPAIDEYYNKGDYEGCIALCSKYYIYDDIYYECNYEYGMSLYNDGRELDALKYLKEASKTYDGLEGTIAEIELEDKYKKAVSAAKKGDIENAIEKLSEISGYKDSSTYLSKCREASRYIGTYTCYSFKIYQTDGTVSDLSPTDGYGNAAKLWISAYIDDNMQIIYSANGVRTEPGSLYAYYKKYDKNDVTIDIANKSEVMQVISYRGEKEERYVYLYQ